MQPETTSRTARRRRDRASTLPLETLERVAWALGIHDWDDREDLERLVDAWPRRPRRRP